MNNFKFGRGIIVTRKVFHIEGVNLSQEEIEIEFRQIMGEYGFDVPIRFRIIAQIINKTKWQTFVIYVGEKISKWRAYMKIIYGQFSHWKWRNH